MGLESVEIVTAWEDEFGVAIPDEVAQELFTPRLATDYLLQQLHQTPANECIRQQTFFRLRSGLRSAEQDRPTRILPSSRLSELVTRKEWPKVWQRIRKTADMEHWPELAPWQGFFAFLGKTVGDLVHELAATDPRGEQDPELGWTREQVSLRVRRVVEAVTGLRLFDEDDRFVDDLGIQ